MSYAKESPDAPHCKPFDLRTAMVLLTLLSVTCDTDANTNDITLPKSHVAHHPNILDPAECNGVTENAIYLM